MAVRKPDAPPIIDLHRAATLDMVASAMIGRMPRIALALLLLAGSIAAYRLDWALGASAVAVLLSLRAARGPLAGMLATAALCALVLWAAFGTVAGFFWLNRHRLEALADDIASLPALRSASVGTDEEREPGHPGGGHFDDYRFINGTVVTAYPRQVAPAAAQPVLLADDVLGRLRVPRARYDRLMAALRRLGLAGFEQDGQREVRLTRLVGGRAPWVEEFVRRPDSTAPAPGCMLGRRRLSGRWQWLLCG